MRDQEHNKKKSLYLWPIITTVQFSRLEEVEREKLLEKFRK